MELALISTANITIRGGIELLVVLAVVAWCLHWLQSFEGAAIIKSLMNLIVVVCAVVYVAHFFGLF